MTSAMAAKLWVTGINPFDTECCVLKEMRVDQLLHQEKNVSTILIRFGSLYGFIACGTNLHTFCILTGRRKTITFDAEIVSLAANSKCCLVLLASGHVQKYDPVVAVPVMLQFLGVESDRLGVTKESITHLACGECVAVACSSTNAVYNIPNLTTTLPRHMRIRKLAVGFEHCLLLTINGDVYSWGGGLRGQLGNGEIIASKDEPCIVEALAGVKIVDIAADGWHSAAVSSFGDLYTWGWNNQGQLGLQDQQHNGRVVSQPQLVTFPDDEELFVKKVHCGIGHTVVEANHTKDVLVAGWVLEDRFHYIRASIVPTFTGFRRLKLPSLQDGEELEVGTGANQIYFLQHTRNE